MREILESYSSTELKKEISKTNIKGYSKMKKSEIVNLMLKNKDRFSHLKKKEKKAPAPKKEAPAPKKKMVIKKPAPKKEEPKKKGFEFRDNTKKYIEFVKRLPRIKTLKQLENIPKKSYSSDDLRFFQIDYFIYKLLELAKKPSKENEYKITFDIRPNLSDLRNPKFKGEELRENLDWSGQVINKLYNKKIFITRDEKDMNRRLKIQLDKEKREAMKSKKEAPKPAPKKEAPKPAPKKKEVNEIGEKLIVLPETNENNKILNQVNKINFEENKKQFKTLEDAFNEKKRLQNITRQKKREENKKLIEGAKKLLERDSPKPKEKQPEKKTSNIKNISQLVENLKNASIEDLKLVQSKDQYEAMIDRIKSGKGRYKVFHIMATLRTLNKDFVKDIFMKYKPSEIDKYFTRLVHQVEPKRETFFPKHLQELEGKGLPVRTLKILTDKLPHAIDKQGKVYKTFKEYNERFDKK